MNRIDWIVVRRLLGNIGLTLIILYGLVVLVESLNTRRFSALAEISGIGAALLSVPVAAARWILDTLSISVLIGAIAGLLSLQTTREMTVIKAAGMSIWRLMAAPLAVTVLVGLIIALAIQPAVVVLDRGFATDGGDAQLGTGTFWMEEKGAPLRYVLEAGYVHPGGETLGDVTIFMLDSPRERIEAATAQLAGGAWVMPQATRYVSNRQREIVTELSVPTTTSRGDMRAKLSSVNDLTVYELAGTLAARPTGRAELAQTLTRFIELIGLPVALCGSLVIAFAFTAGYRRTNKYGSTVLYGIVLGFVVYVVTEMAGRAGEAGAIQPAVAVLGPALVAIVAGATVLLNREDGRT